MPLVTSIRSRPGRRRIVVLATVGLVGAALAHWHASAGPTVPRPVEARAAGAAPRVTGVKMVAAASAHDSSPVKTVEAICPEGKQVVGGGAWISPVPEGDPVPTLTRLEPGSTGSRHRYQVTATEVSPDTASDWMVHAIAACTNPVPGYEVVTSTTGSSAADVRTADPVCPLGKRVLGSGAVINFPLDEPEQGVGLQVASVDANGDTVRTRARRAAAGPSPSQWQLTGYAVCANKPSGYSVVDGRSPEENSEQVKLAEVRCPDRWVNGVRRERLLIGMGAAVSPSAPGNVSLWRIGTAPYFELSSDSAFASAVENTPTSVDWDLIVVRIICVG